ncbi:MAG: hypothetical protein OXG11_12980 [Chloroflexi bacterium]|nr:hypothetical protein [Chloroflexota bacterium]
MTLVFRVMFLLHVEARGHLPVGSTAYRPHSARQLAEDSRNPPLPLSRTSTQLWDRLRTLVRMVRTGDRSAGVPAYNGSLFAADGLVVSCWRAVRSQTTTSPPPSPPSPFTSLTNRDSTTPVWISATWEPYTRRC